MDKAQALYTSGLVLIPIFTSLFYDTYLLSCGHIYIMTLAVGGMLNKNTHIAISSVIAATVERSIFNSVVVFC